MEKDKITVHVAVKGRNQKTVAELVSGMDPDFAVTSTTASVSSAMAILSQNQPMVLAVALPAEEGIPLIRTVFARYPQVRFVLVDEGWSAEDIRQVLHYNIREYLHVPYTREQLQQVLLNLKRELLLAALFGDSNVLRQDHRSLALAYEQPHHLFMICVGNLVMGRDPKAPPIPDGSQINWLRLLREVLPAGRLWYLIDQKDSRQKLLCCDSVIPDQIALRLQQRLSFEMPGRPITVCYSRKSSVGHEILTTTRKIRETMQRRLIPTRGALYNLDEQFPPLRKSVVAFLRSNLIGDLSRLIQAGEWEKSRSQISVILEYVLANDITQSNLEWVCSYILGEYKTFTQMNLPNMEAEIQTCITSVQSCEKLISRLTQLLMRPSFLVHEEKENLACNLVRYVDKYFLRLNDLESLSGMFHYSYAYLSRVFKKETGMTLSRYIQEKRLGLSIDILQRNFRISNTHLAELSGFRDVRNFQRAFKDYTGRSLKEFREEICRQTEIHKTEAVSETAG